MDTKELLKKVRKIEIKTKGLSRHIFSGEYHSAFKGRGMSFSEVRNYQYGDDVRNIDWNVTARYNEPYVKIFEEERELTVMLLVDISKSAIFGSTAQMKSEILTEICAVLAFSATTNNDKVGVILFSSKIELFIPPKKGKRHILRIIRELIEHEQDEKGTDIAKALRYFNNVMKKRCIAFVLSDFMAKDYEDPLRIASRKHDITAIHLFDKAEKKLPNVGLLRVEDPETGEMLWIDTSSRSTREKYEAWFEENFNYFKNVFNKSGVDTVSIETSESYVKALIRFFKKRH